MDAAVDDPAMVSRLLGFVAAAVSLVPAAIGLGAITAQDSAPTLAGRVLDADARPVAGVTVRLMACSHPELPPTVALALGEEATVVVEVKTNDKGVFRTKLPHGGPFTLLAIADDGRRTPARFPVMAGDFVTTSLRAPSVVSGRVLMADGAPAVGALVSEASYGDAALTLERYGRFAEPSTTSTDAAGRFRLVVNDTDPVGWPIALRSLRASMGRSTTTESMYRVDGQSIDGIELRLQPSTVEAADVANERRVCIVRARILGPDGKARQRGVLLSTVIGGPFGRRAYRVETDADGQLEANVATPDVPLHAFVEHEGRYQSLFVIVPPRETSELGELRIATGRTVMGTIVGHDGLPRAGALAMLQPVLADIDSDRLDQGGPSLLTRLTYADASGRFRFDGVPGRPHLLLIHGGFDGLHARHLGVDEEPGTITLGEGDTASGRILLPGGEPAARAQAQYIVMNVTDAALARFGMLYLFGRADAEGRFVVRGLPKSSAFTAWGMCTKDGQSFMTSSASTGTSRENIEIKLTPHGGRF